MTRLSIHKLVLTGPTKPNAELTPGGASHLVFGPTDTGKSYIAASISYCLGSNEKPLDVGLSEGYTRAALQVLVADGSKYTLFRDLIAGNEVVHTGFHDLPPPAQLPVAEDIAPLLVRWSAAANKRILVKSGVLAGVTAGDLRRLSVFDEIRTLDRVPLEGKDKLFKMRNRAAVALALTGIDDSGATLALKTDARNIAKGHVQALEEELTSLRANIPNGWTRADCIDGLGRIEQEIESIDAFMRTNAEGLATLKAQHEVLDTRLRAAKTELIRGRETRDRFELLDEKYENDFNRLTSLITALDVTASFEVRPCPLCKSDINHQLGHDDWQDMDLIGQAANAELAKITTLRRGLAVALHDVDGDIELLHATVSALNQDTAANLNEQASIIRPAAQDVKHDHLGPLSERRAELTVALRSFERIGSIEQRLSEMKAKAKRKKQEISRDFSGSADELCRRISELLAEWRVPMVHAVHFDESHADLYINNRQRVSYGKGKRGIFLTALVVALMERALELGHPHIGLIAIDSPVVTYKDPKHGSQDPDEALDPSVKDQLYAWLADRKGPGQIIVLENEEPSSDVQARLGHTEFVGSGKADGRRGFFPL
ncbi:hypothetical protein [Stenotrophomonas sp. NPDC078853]|uniref:hypothetical protein n=1 Tax=Stenotrophomonas sp. NPDC078853 TaxID=3364534 RepID=UPI00384F501D